MTSPLSASVVGGGRLGVGGLGVGLGLGDFVDRRPRRPRPRRPFGSAISSTSVSLGLGLGAHGSGARARRAGVAAPRRRAARLVAPAALFELVELEALEHDRDVRGALADAEVAPAGVGLAVLARRALVGPRHATKSSSAGIGCCARRSRSPSRATSRRRRPRPSRTAAAGDRRRRPAARARAPGPGGPCTPTCGGSGRSRAAPGFGGGARHQRRLDRSWPAW